MSQTPLTWETVLLPWPARIAGNRRQRSATARTLCAAALIAWVVVRPVRLMSVRWWWSTDIASVLELTDRQSTAIDGVYEAQLAARRQWIERAVTAANRLDDLIRDRADNDLLLEQTHEAAVASAGERALARATNARIADLLEPRQRERLARLLSHEVVE